jgi:hypothetical protein
MEILLDPRLWASLLTLTALEIILGIDNLIFISLVSNRLPASQQSRARRTGDGTRHRSRCRRRTDAGVKQEARHPG